MPIEAFEPKNDTTFNDKQKTVKQPKKSFKKKMTNLIIILGILGSLAYAFQDKIKYVFMQYNINQEIKSLNNDLKKNNNKRLSALKKGVAEKEYNFNYDSVVPISTNEVYNTYSDDMLGIGLVSYPDVGINLPIYYGLDNSNLIYGAGTMKPQQEMGKGNYTLVSHRTDNINLLFTPLERTQLNEKVYLKDHDFIYEYEVFNKVRVTPAHIELTEDVPDKKILTLITCNDMYAVKRLVVQAEFKKKTEIKKADNSLKDVFRITKNPLLQI